LNQFRDEEFSQNLIKDTKSRNLFLINVRNNVESQTSYPDESIEKLIIIITNIFYDKLPDIATELDDFYDKHIESLTV
jgi:hypothetical protein